MWFMATVVPGQGVPDRWSDCKIRAQTEAGCGNDFDVEYTGIDSQNR